jgi:glycosyltransferase involved in cell wall biosynthesis
MTDKLKIVWICPLDFNPFRDRLEFREDPVDVIAPWMTLLTAIFEAHSEETELHVISAPPRLAGDFTLRENGITYYFVSEKMPLLNRKSPFILKKATRYSLFRKKVKKLVNTINPDIIEFHGAEHDLSWSFFDLDYPKILTPQFFVNNYFRFRKTKYLEYWKNVEAMIYKAGRNFSYRNEHMKREILALNPSANLYKYQYPIKKPEFSAADYSVKDADIVFTARLIKSKGIEDLIRAVQLVKTEVPGIRAKIIGQCEPSYLESLKMLAASLGVEENLTFHGFLSTQEEMFKEVAKSKLSVLPTHFDLIPGSIIEAMYIGTAVVAYASGGIPELNGEQETVRLVETGNIAGLAKEIIALLEDDYKRLKLASAAKDSIEQKFKEEQIYSDMIHSYRSVIKNFNKN